MPNIFRNKAVVIFLISLIIYTILQYVGILPLRSMIAKEDGVMNSPLLNANVLITSHGSNLYIAWFDPLKKVVMFRSSNDGGKTFNEPLVLSDKLDVNNIIVRGMIAKGSYVNVIWSASINDHFNVYLSHSDDGGRTFYKTINLSNGKGDSEFPVIDASGPMVYIAWINSMNNNSEIYLRISRDGGKTFDEPINISNSGHAEEPALAAEGSNVYIAWNDRSLGRYVVMLRVSYDNGKTFSDKVILSDPNYDSRYVSLTTEGNNVYIAWVSYKGNYNEIYLRVSRDSGKTFDEPLVLSKEEYFSYPLLTLDGPLVSIAWVVKQDGVKFTSMLGNELRDKVTLVNNTTIKNVVVDVDGYNVGILLLEDKDKTNRIVYINSRDGGLTFSKPKILTEGIIDYVSMKLSNTNVYIAWSTKSCSNEDCSIVNLRYYFIKSEDLGSTFTTPTRLN